MTAAYPPPRDEAPLVVFDFDHTLYDGDSGSHLFKWLIDRAWWRRALALLLAPVAGPLVAFLPTRRAGISAFVWAGTVGVHDRTTLEVLIGRYVALHGHALQARLLPRALEVFQKHRAHGDRVLVATGAPPELARAILALAGHGDVPVIGTLLAPRLGGMGARRHCHHAMKMAMIRAAGYAQPVAQAYSDSSADLPLLQAAARPVVVNPKPGRVAWFRRVLPAGTPILHWGSRGRGGDPA
ncbi:haloacid dehalogenase-like hydrolase [Thermomonas flagellata]|uniref:haloacid dehalogenase-like hydrolase n=1 Tax=Thermomonas flagellata TaxID=2888524 RepID=UPI001F03BF6D|nr:haloacid dehalogenase-like hydrolase [Thermomonas flagellata]